MLYGYARVLNNDEDQETQLEYLEDCGVSRSHIVLERDDPARSLPQPELRNLLNRLRANDTLVIATLARFSNSIEDAHTYLEELLSRSIIVRIGDTELLPDSVQSMIMLDTMRVMIDFEAQRSSMFRQARTSTKQPHSVTPPALKRRPPHRLTAQERQDILKALDSGDYTYEQLARAANVSESTIKRLASTTPRSATSPRGRRPRLDSTQRRLALEMYAEGNYTQSQVAQHFGIALSTFKRMLPKNNDQEQSS